MSITNSIAFKLAMGVLGVTFVFGLLLASATPARAALTTSQVDAIIALLQSFGADSATVDNVRTSLTGGTPTTPSGGSTASVCPFTWSTSLTKGSTGADVLALQKFLNSDSATTIASSGVGSAGSETDYFGSLTSAAVVKFQNKYASEVLTPVGLSAGTGYFGSSSRAKANSLCAVASTGSDTTTDGDDTTTPPVATGTGLSVVAGSQPTATLAPDSAARVPFTKFIVTAGSDGDVVMDNVTIERTGLAPDAVFSGIVLLDSDGVQIGTSKTLNSNHQSTVGSAVTIPAGTSRMFTIAGNMASDNSTRDGTIATLSVIAINTSATVSGSLPIVGTAQTINASLAIGSVTMGISSFDPNSAQTKEIGTTGVRVAGITVTAGSAEEIRINSIRWNQTGSAGSGDLANVVTIIDGTEYTTTVSSDGKFYTAKIGSGIVVGKGNLVDIYVKIDIIGGSARTVIFDIDKTTDLNITGETFGYGITPPAGTGSVNSTSSQFYSGTPWFDNAHLTISAGSVTSIQKATSVPAQNIAVNVSNQPLGGFETDIKGEAINISGMTLTVATSSGSGTGLLTNVTIVDQNGAVVAGPIDATRNSGTVMDLIFTDSITIPIGKMIYTVKGKLSSNEANGGTYIVSVTPSGWTSPIGDVTGDAITISQGVFALNTMTVKAAALNVTVSLSPVAQNITAGTNGFTFANYQLDASDSGEDVRFSAMVAIYDTDAGKAASVSKLSACQLWDGSTPLNTGSNIVTPTTTATTSASDLPHTFTFDETLVLPKGTIKTLALKCNISSSVDTNSTFAWGARNGTAADMVVTGVTSSNTVAEEITTSTGQAMTVAAASLTITVDSSSPSYSIAAGGTTGVIAGVVKFRAANEEITLQKLGLTLTGGYNRSSDLTQVYIYDGVTLVGTAVFTGANTTATSTLSIPVTLPKDTDKTLTIKVDLADIGTSQIGTQGDLVKVDPLNAEGVGASSGTTIKTSASGSVAGIRLLNSFPTVALMSLNSGISDGRLMRFSITADSAGSIGLGEFTFTTATTSAVITNVGLYSYTDSAFSLPISGQETAGQIDALLATSTASAATDCFTTAGSTCVDTNSTTRTFTFVPASTQVTIPAGTTRYFELRSTVAGSGTTFSVVTKLTTDTAFATGTATGVSGVFIWNPNATTDTALSGTDWTTGYGVSGLPSSGLIQSRTN